MASVVGGMIAVEYKEVQACLDVVEALGTSEVLASQDRLLSDLQSRSSGLTIGCAL